MQKRILFTLASFSFILSLSMAQNGEQAKAILDKTYGAYQASDGIQLSFTVSTLDQNNTLNDTQSGKAYIKRDKFKLEMEAMNVWFDGKTQWVLIKEVNEVNISQPTGQEIASISPLALLGMYKSGYSLEAPVSATVNGKGVYRINMTPTSGKRDFQSVSVAIDKTAHTLAQVVLTLDNGLKTQIDISKYNANFHYADTEFTFDTSAHPGAEIVDLR